MIVPWIISINTLPVSTRVPDWNTRLHNMYVEPEIVQGIVTMTFVPVAVPVFVRVIICSIVSLRRSFPQSFISLSTAVEIR